ncbi:oxidoreductase [Brevibacillus choshinensis]|uniref:Oxidoreductase n=1 Tax=Brevibacillus choshinensis TaxID=54911 RepID=A0ABR5N4B8_BRECH|nr:SDR family NAD(P)-dependent oxidoreductase [Brevibacillus choshinensis]KQL45488.1 oxidoreductase [Brevibacillus choshinensis]
MTLQRIVVITGASSGLGRALTRLHLDKGDLVIATGRKAAGLQALTLEHQQNERLHTQMLDVTDNEAARQLAAWVHVRFGRCDLLYNNAGTAVFAALADMRLEELEETLQTNIAGVMYTTRAFLPMMQQAHAGHIINIASLAGQVATSKAAVYAASKAAIIRFSEGLQHELAEYGIHVTCAMPGPIDTPFLDRADRTGNYRNKVSRYLLTPEQTAALISRAVERKKPEVAMPLRLHYLSLLYAFLPHSVKRLVAPLLNRK